MTVFFPGQLFAVPLQNRRQFREADPAAGWPDLELSGSVQVVTKLGQVITPVDKIGTF